MDAISFSNSMNLYQSSFPMDYNHPNDVFYGRGPSTQQSQTHYRSMSNMQGMDQSSFPLNDNRSDYYSHQVFPPSPPNSLSTGQTMSGSSPVMAASAGPHMSPTNRPLSSNSSPTTMDYSFLQNDQEILSYFMDNDLSTILPYHYLHGTNTSPTSTTMIANNVSGGRYSPTLGPMASNGSDLIRKMNTSPPIPSAAGVNMMSMYDSSSNTNGSNNSSVPVYQVRFKRDIRHFLSDFTIRVGDFVRVHGDRGEDIGYVIGTTNLAIFFENKRRSQEMTKSTADYNGIWELKNILRLASYHEIEQLRQKIRDEKKVIQNCHELVQNVYFLPITIVDVEFQFDRKKLIIYYDSDKRVDFREFVRSLYALYKTRIWMQHIDSTMYPSATSPSNTRMERPPPIPQQQYAKPPSPVHDNSRMSMSNRPGISMTMLNATSGMSATMHQYNLNQFMSNFNAMNNYGNPGYPSNAGYDYQRHYGPTNGFNSPPIDFSLLPR